MARQVDIEFHLFEFYQCSCNAALLELGFYIYKIGRSSRELLREIENALNQCVLCQTHDTVDLG